MSMQTQNIQFSFFHKAAFQNSYPYVITEDICSQLIRNLQHGFNAGRRRKLAEIGNYQLPPAKKIALETAAKPRPVEKEDRINALPNEILLEIFRFVSGPADRYACASVCMRWLMLQSHLHVKDLRREETVEKELAAGDELKRNLEGRRATDVRLALIALGTQGRGGLGKLTVRGGPKQSPTKGVSEIGFSSVGICCGALKTLSVWDCPTVNDAAFSWIGKGCHELKTLNVLNCPGLGDAGLQAIAKGCPRLTSLILEGCDNVGDEGLKAVALNCNELSVLSIVGCKKMGDTGITSVVSNCKSLKALKLEKLGIRDTGLTSVGEQAKALQKLKLVHLPHISTEGFSAFGKKSNMEQLKHLHIESCPGFVDSFLEAFGKGSRMVKLLSLVNCKLVAEDKLVAFMNDCNSLEGIYLDKCDLVSSTVFPGATPNNCVTLKSLGISRCQGAGGAFLARVTGDSCLKKLDLSGSVNLTDEEMVTFFASCKFSLSTLNLSGCAKITNKTVAGFSVHCSSVESLTLEGCVGITDQGLHLVAQQCLALRELDISKCTVTDEGLLALLAARGPFFKTLSLAGCEYVTNRCLPLIERDCSSLDALNMKECKNISQSELESFESRFCSCQVCF